MDGREHGTEQDHQQHRCKYQSDGRRRERDAKASRGGKEQNGQRREGPRRSRPRAGRPHMTTSSESGNGPCVKHRQPSAIWSIDKMPGRFDRTIIIEIVMTAFGKPHESFRLVGKREKTLPMKDR